MNYWEYFGLSQNPYTILPLLEGGELPITEAFVGRSRERKYVRTLLMSEDRASVIICGGVGIGKTSFANFIKYAWKYEEETKPLFSFRREIEAHPELLNKRSFLLEIIGSILREIELIDPQLLKRSSFLTKLNHMVDVTQSLGISGSVSASFLGITAQTDIAEKQLNLPLQLTTTALEKQFLQLLDYISSNKIAGKHYQGLIIHVNNFEVALSNNKKQVVQFFSEIRDILQIPKLFFFFLGPTNLFSDVINKDLRVKSVFTQTPILLTALTKEELVKAINKRIELLKSPTAKKVIKPFTDEVIFALYDLYDGDVRLIMNALKDIFIAFADKLPKTLTMQEAMFLLASERLVEVQAKITPEQMNVLQVIILSKSPITQSEIATKLQKSPTNISNYYFKPLIENAIIEIKKTEGRNKYWGLTKRYLPLAISSRDLLLTAEKS